MPLDLSPAALKRLTEQVPPDEAEPPAELSTQPPPGIGPWPYIAEMGGQGADILSTLAAKRRGAVEANPTLGDFGGPAIAAKAGSAALLAYAMKQLASHGHPKIAKGLGYGAGIGLGALAARNATVR